MNEACGKAGAKADKARQELPDRIPVIIECPDERSQVEALRLCRYAGLNCKADML